MSGITLIDLLVIVAYFLLLVGLGVVAMFRIKNQEDYFLGGRRFGRILQTLTAFGQATSSENAVGTVTTTYRDGAGGIWSQLILLWATPFYWFTARWYRRMRLLTLGDFFRERYGSRRMGMVYSGVASFYMIIIIAISLKAVGVTVLGMTLKHEADFTPVEQAEYAAAIRMENLQQKFAVTELSAEEAEELRILLLENPSREFSALNELWLVWGMVLIVLAYSLAGGLEGAIWSDAVQSVLIVVLSLLLIPFAVMKLNAMYAVNGLHATAEILHRELPSYYFSPFGSPESAQFTWYFIIALSLMATINVAVQANQFTANASARDELAAGIGFTSGTFIKRFLTVIWGLLALLCFALYGREIRNSDLVWGHATKDLLGGLNMGLVGLMIACMMAALQSTASTLMMSSSALLTRNVYAPIVSGRSEAHYILAGRVSGALFLIMAALLSTAFNNILEMLKFLWEFNAVVAATFWCGLKWRRATRQGAWASISSALVLFMLLPIALPGIFPGLRTAESMLRQTDERVIEQTYEATLRDVEERDLIIQQWEGNHPPASLTIGEPMSRPIVMAPRAIYWTQGIATTNGAPAGRGMFLPEMWLLDQVVDLSKNPYALNETIRYVYKIVLPFFILIVVSLLTRRDESAEVRRFFLRMRTQVRADREEDELALAAAYADPDSTERQLLFPQSNLEFFKWSRLDAVGFVIAFGAAFSVVGFLYLILTFGA